MAIAVTRRLELLGWIPGFLLSLPLVALWIARAMFSEEAGEQETRQARRTR
jgi:hypothetical protein